MAKNRSLYNNYLTLPVLFIMISNHYPMTFSHEYNWAILGAARASPSRRHVVTTSVEHPAVLEVCRGLAREGYEVSFLPVDRQGRLDPAPPLTSRRPTPLSCKLCDFRAPQGQADAFCPRCLAETLRPDSK